MTTKAKREKALLELKAEVDNVNEQSILESVGLPVDAQFDPAPIAARVDRLQNLLSTEARSQIPNFGLVIAQLSPTLHSVAVDNWLRLPNIDLVHEGRALSPIEWLTRGLAVEPVLTLAEGL